MTRQKIRGVIARLHILAGMKISFPPTDGVARDTLELLNWIAANGDSYQDHLLERAIYEVDRERKEVQS